MTDENLKPCPFCSERIEIKYSGEYLMIKHDSADCFLGDLEEYFQRAFDRNDEQLEKTVNQWNIRAQEPTGDAPAAEAIRTLGNGMEDYGMPEEPSWRAHLKTLSDFVNQSPAAENAIPPGFALVPLEPTEAMRAAWNSHPGNDESYFSPLFYKAMIAAAGETK